MPRKPRRAPPDAPAKPDATTAWSWGADSGHGANTGGTSESGLSKPTTASTRPRANAGAKAGAGSTANDAPPVHSAAKADSAAKVNAGPGPGGKAKAGGKPKVGARIGANTRQGPTPAGMPGTRDDLSRVEIEAIREFALELARKGVGPDAVLICNPISEPSALPAKELLYDRCRWCETDIYYDRLMPSPPDMMRVCLKCGILLLEAEKKGKN